MITDETDIHCIISLIRCTTAKLIADVCAVYWQLKGAGE